jgi:hypothetical protein
MIRAESIPCVIDTPAVRFYLCHDWAMAQPEELFSSRQASLHLTFFPFGGR